ncbi:hypothetical protein M427DRAFT_505802 [Gonapodya prolifera JEL478]|uniref:Uncharacterized protein n=1 Tax=Gonapodya prolifera (strain JEL478) TaxID=1344416 RepID=A0A139A360_GONPJ|nr:hypothetical protein M427DRAFT_505802 [Gonapodya prolifera JEL478]|eukprot:KXS11201.1 hypothetical protein M427DRAFT_505802 [Gonapodya prolifera JEL478]
MSTTAERRGAALTAMTGGGDGDGDGVMRAREMLFVGSRERVRRGKATATDAVEDRSGSRTRKREGDERACNERRRNEVARDGAPLRCDGGDLNEARRGPGRETKHSTRHREMKPYGRGADALVLVPPAGLAWTSPHPPPSIAQRPQTPAQIIAEAKASLRNPTRPFTPLVSGGHASSSGLLRVAVGGPLVPARVRGGQRALVRPGRAQVPPPRLDPIDVSRSMTPVGRVPRDGKSDVGEEDEAWVEIGPLKCDERKPTENRNAAGEDVASAPTVPIELLTLAHHLAGMEVEEEEGETGSVQNVMAECVPALCSILLATPAPTSPSPSTTATTTPTPPTDLATLASATLALLTQRHTRARTALARSGYVSSLLKFLCSSYSEPETSGAATVGSHGGTRVAAAAVVVHVLAALRDVSAHRSTRASVTRDPELLNRAMRCCLGSPTAATASGAGTAHAQRLEDAGTATHHAASRVISKLSVFRSGRAALLYDLLHSSSSPSSTPTLPPPPLITLLTTYIYHPTTPLGTISRLAFALSNVILDPSDAAELDKGAGSEGGAGSRSDSGRSNGSDGRADSDGSRAVVEQTRAAPGEVREALVKVLLEAREGIVAALGRANGLRTAVAARGTEDCGGGEVAREAGEATRMTLRLLANLATDRRAGLVMARGDLVDAVAVVFVPRPTPLALKEQTNATQDEELKLLAAYALANISFYAATAASAGRGDKSVWGDAEGGMKKIHIAEAILPTLFHPNPELVCESLRILANLALFDSLHASSSATASPSGTTTTPVTVPTIPTWLHTSHCISAVLIHLHHPSPPVRVAGAGALVNAVVAPGRAGRNLRNAVREDGGVGALLEVMERAGEGGWWDACVVAGKVVGNLISGAVEANAAIQDNANRSISREDDGADVVEQPEQFPLSMGEIGRLEDLLLDLTEKGRTDHTTEPDAAFHEFEEVAEAVLSTLERVVRIDEVDQVDEVGDP